MVEMNVMMVLMKILKYVMVNWNANMYNITDINNLFESLQNTKSISLFVTQV